MLAGELGALHLARKAAGRVGKKIPGAPGFFPLAVRASGLLPEGAEAAAAAARAHGTRVWQQWRWRLLELNT